jgi:hypothetical protein
MQAPRFTKSALGRQYPIGIASHYSLQGDTRCKKFIA